MFHVYILKSEKTGRFYIGHTANLEDRIVRHNQGRSKATKHGIPWKLVFTEQYSTKSDAYQREIHIKSMKSRTFIENLTTD